MEPWTEGASSLILDRSVEELLAAMIVALVLSAAGGAIGAWACRSRKDETTRLTGVMFGVTILGMVVSGTFVHTKLDRGSKLLAPALPPAWIDHGRASHGRSPMFYRMQVVLDLDGDGLATFEEIREASELLGTDRRHASGPPWAPGERPVPRRVSAASARSSPRSAPPSSLRDRD
jgi:hypothetical protein